MGSCLHVCPPEEEGDHLTTALLAVGRRALPRRLRDALQEALRALPATSDGVAPVATLPTSNSAEGALTEIPPSPDGSIQGVAPDT